MITFIVIKTEVTGSPMDYSMSYSWDGAHHATRGAAFDAVASHEDLIAAVVDGEIRRVVAINEVMDAPGRAKLARQIELADRS